MALRKETVTKKTEIETQAGVIERNAEVEEVVYDLVCDVCGAKGGEIRFPINHGRESDEHLEKELKENHSHLCDEHAPKV